MILLSSSPNLPLTLNPSKTSDKVECRLPQEQYHACNRFRSQMKDSNQEFANSNTCCPGVEDQWQGRAPSDILTSESKQLNRGTTLMYMNVISCWMHSSFHLWEMWPMPMHNAGQYSPNCRLLSCLVASLASSWIFTHIVRSETEHILTRFFSSSKAFAIDCGNAATTLKITRKEVSAVYSGTVWFGLF